MAKKQKKIVFCGTPGFAEIILKKLIVSIMFIALFSANTRAQSNKVISLSNWSNRVITSGDTLKSYWMPIYDSDSFTLFVDFGAQGDSANCVLSYWLALDISGATDTTSAGYIRDDQSGFMTLKTISSSTLSNDGKLYFSGQYPGSVAISPARYIQYVIYASTDHDSLTVESATFLKYKE